MDRRCYLAADAVGEQRHLLREQGDFAVAGGLGRGRLVLKHRDQICLAVDASGTAELDEVIGQQRDEFLRLADVGLEQRLFQFAEMQ